MYDLFGYKSASKRSSDFMDIPGWVKQFALLEGHDGVIGC